MYSNTLCGPPGPVKKNAFMRMIIILIVLGCTFITASLQAQTVTLSMKNAPVKNVLKEIIKQTKTTIIYTEATLKDAKPVSINVENATVEQALAICFKDQPLTYTVNGNTFVVKEKKESPGNRPDIAPDQQSVITGKIVDMDNNPLVGVTITVQNTGKSTISDSKGEFELKGVSGNTRIRVSAVGFLEAVFAFTEGKIFLAPESSKSKPNIETEGNAANTVQFGAGNHLVVRLARTISSMGTVVVTGITQRANNSFTGSATTISGSELKTVSANNVFSAITAFDPSFRVLPNNVLGGNINQLPDVQLRGANSLPNLGGELAASSNLPLFILDGFEVSLQRIVDLDMNLINSITILKDASATAIYGSRGANGVMVVTTLAPKPGKIQVIVTNDYRLTTPDLSVYDLLNSKEKLDFEQRAGVYIGNGNQDQNDKDIQYNQRLKAVESGINTNWKKLPVQTGHSNRTSLYLQGGDQSIRYGLQMAADLQNGVMKGQDRKNYSGQFDLQYNVSKFRFSNSVRLYQNISNESPYGDFSDYLGMNPYWSPFDGSGRIKPFVEEIQLTTVTRRTVNPLYDVSLNSLNRQTYFGFTNNFTMRYDVLPNLFFQTNLSISKQEGSTDQFFSAADSRFVSVADPAQKGSYTVRSDKSSGYESLTTANYNVRKGRSQFFNTFGFNFASTQNSYYTIVTQGFPFDRLDNLLFAAQYPAGSRPTGDEGSVRRLGFVYTGNYSFDNRFLADLSFRRDGSSQFGAKERYGNFWSTGIGWNLHNESLFKNNPHINTLRLRASYGSTGSLNIPAYSAQWRYTFGVNNIYFNDLGAVLQGMGNENLQWQNVYKLNVGLNAVLFKEKLDLRVEVYKENTKNTLSPVSLAPSTGFANYQENLGEVENKGFEFYVRYKLMQQPSKGLLWTVNLNGFTNSNILKSISNKLKAINDKLDTLGNAEVRPNILLKEGQSMNTIYVVRSLGVDPVTGQEVYLTKDGKPTYVWSVADKVPYGISIPKWSGTFGTNFSYMGFDLNLIFNYQFGGQLYNTTLSERVESANPLNNVDRRAYDLGWTKPGDRSPYTRIRVSKPATQLTSRFVQDDDNISLSSASLGYNFYRSPLLKKLRLNSLSVRLITNDLFRISSIQIERGTNTPFARTFSLSVRAGF